MIKKYSKQIIIALVLIELSCVFLMVKSYTNKDIDKIKETSKIDRKMFTMYVEQDDGTYKEETDTDYFPSVGYRINEEKTYCVDHYGEDIDQAITFKDGSITVTGNKTVFCTLYFKKKGDDITVTVSTSGTTGVVPTSGGYKASLTCDTADSSFNEKYQRVEISAATNDEEKCNLDYTKADTSSYTTLKSEVESKATTITSTNYSGGTDTSYRYSGKTPDNYVWFNNEMWRIIGSIPTCTSSGCGTSENLVKIIRNESIGSLKLGGDSWEEGTLYNLLNGYYRGKKNATETSFCYAYMYDGVALCDYTRIGISTNSKDYYGRMMEFVYWNTGTVNDISYTVSSSYTNETSIQTVSGYIGLMTISDYGYASGVSTSMISDLDDYEQNNWLYGQGNEWTITYYDEGYGMNIWDQGMITQGGDSGEYNGHKIRPVLYLDSTIYIISGTGTQADPYIIGM